MKSLIVILILSVQFISVSAQSFKQSKENNNKYALFDDSGNQLTKYKYDLTNDFFEGNAAVVRKGVWGYVNEKGKEIIKCKYWETHYFSEGFCPVSIKGIWIFLDDNGKMPFKKNFQYAFPFANGLAAVKLDDKWGYINTTGEFIIPPKFESAFPFSEDMAQVQYKKMWGYINSKGNVVIDFNFDQAGPFKNNEASVMINSKKFKIDRRGKIKKQEEVDSSQVKKIYKIVEKMPVYPGGYDKLFEYLDENLVFPASQKADGIKGEVIVKILVNKDGTISDPKIVKGLTTSCDVEAIRLVSNMPKWNPGIHKGKAVNVQLQIPIKFE